MSESDNLAQAGTDTALSLEQASQIDFYDPGEDNEEVEEQQPEPQTGEEEPEQEEPASVDDEAEPEEEEGPDEESDKPEPEDDVTVTINGEKVALSDLKAGYMRQADYSRKTQEVANRRRDLEALSARVNQSVEAIADYLIRQLPAEPPAQLAVTDPGTYVRQKAIHDAAVQQLNSLLSQVGEVRQVTETLTAEQRRELLEAENAKLAEKFPTVATKEGRDKFFKAAAEAARELGYTDEEIQTAADHRMFALAHYAALGLRAEKAKSQAKAKVENKPPVAKPRRQTADAKVLRNREAMKRLEKTGSIHDAVMIDFE